MTPGGGNQHRAQMYTGNRHQPSACTTMLYKAKTHKTQKTKEGQTNVLGVWVRPVRVKEASLAINGIADEPLARTRALQQMNI